MENIRSQISGEISSFVHAWLLTCCNAVDDKVVVEVIALGIRNAVPVPWDGSPWWFSLSKLSLGGIERS